jgi:hypothetical protein
LSRKTKIRLVCFSLRELTGLNNFFFNLTKNKFDFVFPRSNYLKEKLIGHGFPEKKIKVVTTLPNKEQFMTMLDVPNTVKRIAYLSSAEKNAGIDLIPQLAEALPDITFTVALRQFGAREESTTKSLAEKLENKKLKNLFVVRNITDIVNFYKQQDAIILPPLNERDTMSAPLVLFESFLSGRLVLLSDLPLFKDYQNLSFCFKDLKDLINIINEIKTNSEKIEQKIKVAYEYATQLPSQIDAAKIYQS